MSSFGAKRKARKITVQDDDEHTSQPSVTTSPTPETDQGPALQATFKTRKPLKQSSLRKSINFDDAESKEEDEEDGGAPLRIRPLAKAKPKRAPSSKLSFGPDIDRGGGDDDDAMVLGDDLPTFTPMKKSEMASAAAGSGSIKRGIARNSRLPLRSMDSEVDDRPRYSKEYLAELQNSTPNTPASIGSLPNEDGDVEMSLDPSELEGATVVETTPMPAETKVLTESQIAEKKARRARLAQQSTAEDFISLSDDDNPRGDGISYHSVLSRRQPSAISSKKEKRLVTDDNLDDDDSFFVEDGGLSLGKKAEKAARRRRRADMASLINAAEGADNGGETSDDSEAERRAAYEKAQTRAGMDGLAEEREKAKARQARMGTVQVPPKITPLPDLSVLVEDFREKMGRKQAEIQRMRARIDELRAEKEGISRREPEVQQLLNETGERYKALMDGNGSDGGGALESGNDSVAAARSLLEQAKAAYTPGGRGLDSLGATPVRGEQMEM